MKSWSSLDDDNLVKLADQYKNDWKKIAKRIITNNKKKVTPNFLKNRYKEVAGDHIKKGVKFTHEEDLKIAELFNTYGTCWTKIAATFPDRTPVMIKNRYYSHIRRKGLLTTLITEVNGGEPGYEGQSSDDSSDSKEEAETIVEEPLKPQPKQLIQLPQLGQLSQFAPWTNPSAAAFFFPYELSEAVDVNRYFADEELHSKVTPYGEEPNMFNFARFLPTTYPY